MKTAKIVDDAQGRYIKEISEGLPPSAGYSTEQHRYKHVLGRLQGSRFPIADDVQGGVQHYDNILVGEKLTDHNGKPIRSEVIAVPTCYLEDIQEEEGLTVTPCEEPTGSMKMQTVRLLTPWVDGFQAHIRPTLLEGLTGEQKLCPFCGSDRIYTSYWKGSNQHFHLCEEDTCRIRFVTRGVDEPEDH